MDFWGEQCQSVKSRVGLAHLDTASAEGRDPKAAALGAHIYGDSGTPYRIGQSLRDARVPSGMGERQIWEAVLGAHTVYC